MVDHHPPGVGDHITSHYRSRNPNYTKNYGKIHHAINGKTHYFYWAIFKFAHCWSLPEGISPVTKCLCDVISKFQRGFCWQVIICGSCRQRRRCVPISNQQRWGEKPRVWNHQRVLPSSTFNGIHWINSKMISNHQTVVEPCHFGASFFRGAEQVLLKVKTFEWWVFTIGPLFAALFHWVLFVVEGSNLLYTSKNQSDTYGFVWK